MSNRLDDRRVTFRDPVTGEWRTIHTLSALGRAAAQAAAGWPGAAAVVEFYCRAEQRMLAIARIRCDCGIPARLARPRQRPGHHGHPGVRDPPRSPVGCPVSAEVVIRLARLQRHALRVGARFLAEMVDVARSGSGDALVELLDRADLLAAPGGRAALEAA